MKIAEYIDHTLLKPDATEDQIIQLCNEAKEHGFASVCVNPCNAILISKELKDTNIKTCIVIGFPLGATTTQSKVFEAKDGIKNGAQEIDIVINIGALKYQKFGIVEDEIRAIVEAINGKARLKVIIECCLLNDDEKVKACQIAVRAGADFVKTSTGFSSGGATLEDVKLMRKTVGDKIGVKASGGIRDYKTAISMIEAGANRIGASSGVKIVRESLKK
ncbi:MAG: deoxyribose-phosphate aldolase [Candidatus Helarchaeota archaeon]|nr:deoxyribose-phosphate aldolase [Candidatus Helarchaeota archaeon]